MNVAHAPAMLAYLAHTLDALLHSLPRQRQVAAQSYAHPNGFIKIPLGQDEDGGALRLHFWGQNAAPSNIHSHRWNMASLILQGAYRATDYVERADGIPCAKFRCSENDEQQYRLVPMGRSNIAAMHAQAYARGDVYGLEAGIAHAITETSVDEPVISLVTCSVPLAGHSCIYTLDHGAPHNPPTLPVDVAALRAVAVAALRAIDQT